MTSITEYAQIVKVVWPSLLCAAGLAIAASQVGVFVLLRREAMVALALPQVVAVGAAIGLRYGSPTLPPALLAVIIAVALLVLAQRRNAAGWMLPSLYIAGLSISFLIIANSGAHVAELQALFTGIDVAVSPTEALTATPILAITGIATSLLWRRWLLLAQARATAEAAGLRPQRWDALFLLLLSIILLIGTSALGAVMTCALLFLPAATMLFLARRIPWALWGAGCIAIGLLACGMICSVEWNLPLSQSVGGAGFAAVVAASLISWARS